jgi:hypothetical protein
MKWPKIFISNSGDDTPPWVKGTSDGKLYIDSSDERYQRFFRAQLEYFNQWGIEDGGLVEKDESIKLPKPNWRDFV